MTPSDRSHEPLSCTDPARTRRSWLQACVATTAACLSGAVSAQPASAAAEEALAPPLPPLGSRLRVPRLELFGGEVFEPSRLQGRALLVYWWSSTCPFCALQTPSMQALWDSQKDRGLAMLALSIDRKPEDAVAYLKHRGYRFPAGWASPAWRKGFPKPKGLPITLLLGPDGTVRLAEKGQMFPEDVEAIAGLI